MSYGADCISANRVRRRRRPAVLLNRWQPAPFLVAQLADDVVLFEFQVLGRYGAQGFARAADAAFADYDVGEALVVTSQHRVDHGSAGFFLRLLDGGADEGAGREQGGTRAQRLRSDACALLSS